MEGFTLNYILGGIFISVLLNYYDPEEVIKMNDNIPTRVFPTPTHASVRVLTV